MNVKKTIAAAFVLISAKTMAQSPGAPGCARPESLTPPPIPKVCEKPEDMMSQEQFQNAVSDMMKQQILEFRTNNQRLMLKGPSALERLRQSNRADWVCAMWHVVCW